MASYDCSGETWAVAGLTWDAALARLRQAVAENEAVAIFDRAQTKVCDPEEPKVT